VEHTLNPKLQPTQGLSAQESRLAVMKRRAYLVACLVALPGIATGFFGPPDLIRYILYAVLFLCTLSAMGMLFSPKTTIQQLERFGFSYSAAFIVLRSLYTLYSAQTGSILGLALTEAYSSLAFVALLGYILLDTRTALRASVIVMACISLMGLSKVIGMLEQPDHANLIVVVTRAFTNAVAYVAFSYVLALTKDLLAVEQIRSSTDPLTGAANRWQMYNSLEREWLACQTHKQSFSVILLDIDHFKRVNDLHGHNAGDIVLQELTRVFKKSIGNHGSLGRWGGEEFLILLPHASLEEAQVHAETLRVILAKHKFSVGQVTASFGVASLLPSETTNDLMRRVDEAMYSAKLAGRNRVEIEARVLAVAQDQDLDFIDPRSPNPS
jgi:diguanylate cyclase (GGDEF)-like protein